MGDGFEAGPMIEVERLAKRYGETRALGGVDFAVPTTLVRALDSAGALVDTIEVRHPSLDDVFFALTGGRLAGDGLDDGAGAAAAPGRARNDHEPQGVRA